MEIKMSDKKGSHKTSKETRHAPSEFVGRSEGRAKIELVLKCDTMGSVEAISALLANLKLPEAEVKLIQSGVGNIAKQDLLMALTGSRLVIGFNVEVTPKLEQWVKEHGVEVRLYDVIYRLAEDLKAIARNLAPVEDRREGYRKMRGDRDLQIEKRGGDFRLRGRRRRLTGRKAFSGGNGDGTGSQRQDRIAPDREAAGKGSQSWTAGRRGGLRLEPGQGWRFHRMLQ